MVNVFSGDRHMHWHSSHCQAFSRRMKGRSSPFWHPSTAARTASGPYSPTQLSHRLQWEARGGRKILQVKQYFSFTVWPLMMTSLVLGGGRYPPELVPLAISTERRKTAHTFRTPFQSCGPCHVIQGSRLVVVNIPRAAATLDCPVLS